MSANPIGAATRQAALFESGDLSVVDYDSAELSLQASEGARLRLQAQDELRPVCRSVCLRKEASKAGSVLLLRFCHGYHPSEIALLLRTSRQAVDERLRLARSEAKLYLEDPIRLKFIAEGQPLKLQTSQAEKIGFISSFDINFGAALLELLGLLAHSRRKRRLLVHALLRRIIAHFLRDLHRAEVRAAH